MLRLNKHLIALLLISSTVQAKEVLPLPEPEQKPDWSALRTEAENAVKVGLFDPGAAQIHWTSGFEWGTIKYLPFGRRTWGWVGCLELNAKNRLGGYVGPQQIWYMHPAEGKSDFGPANYKTVGGATSQCDTPSKVALQPELGPLLTTVQTSVADELSKLGMLLDKGLLTRPEYDAEKARLLGSPER